MSRPHGVSCRYEALNNGAMTLTSYLHMQTVTMCNIKVIQKAFHLSGLEEPKKEETSFCQECKACMSMPSNRYHKILHQRLPLCPDSLNHTTSEPWTLLFTIVEASLVSSLRLRNHFCEEELAQPN